MDWFSIFIIYVMSWWVVLFMVLPVGVRVPEAPEAGHDPGAPENPRIKEKMIATTLLAIPATGLVYAFVHSGVINFGHS
jgi:predicted secreted protein